MSQIHNSFNLSFPAGFSISVTGEFSFDLQEIQTLSASYLPGSVIAEKSGQPAITVEYIQSDTKDLVVSNTHIKIYDNWHQKISLDLWHLLYSIVRLQYFSQGFYPVHSSCIGKDEHLMLLGHTGLGKTTVTMKLLNDYPELRLFSGNKTVVDISQGFSAIAGTKAISIRQEDQAKYPELVKDAHHFSARSAFELDQTKYDSRNVVSIKAICLVRIDDGLNQLSRLNFPSSLHTLYSYFTDSIYADTVMCDGQKVFSGEVTPVQKDLLSQKLSLLLKDFPVYSVRGSVQYLSEQIKNIL